MATRQKVRRRFLAALVVPFLVLIATGSTQFLYRCVFDGGEAQTSCCCPPEEAEEDAELALRAACCCDIEELDAVAMERRVQVEGHGLAAFHPMVAGAALPPPPRVASSAMLRPGLTTAHPPHGPPLIVLKTSFLL